MYGREVIILDNIWMYDCLKTAYTHEFVSYFWIVANHNTIICNVIDGSYMI